VKAGSTQLKQDRWYEEVQTQFGAALRRLARAYEADANFVDDLLQDIHLAVWRSFGSYNCRCSLRTWVYRVAHNTAASHVVRRTRLKRQALVTLDEVDRIPDHQPLVSETAARVDALDRLLALIHQLDPLDRQIMVAYLEEMDASAIGDMTGLSPGAVATRIYRIKSILALRFHQESGA